MATQPPRNNYRNRPPLIQRRVTGHDFNLFAAIVGSQPIMEPKAAEQAATEEMAAEPPAPELTVAMRIKKELAALPKGKISAAALAGQVRQIFEKRTTPRMKRPAMANWIRQVSNGAVRRIEEAQVRLASHRNRVAQQREHHRRAA
jgi:hypothetical protein